MRNAIIFLLLCCGCAEVRAPSLGDTREVQRLIDQGTLHLRTNDLERARAAFRLADRISPTPGALDGLGCVALLEENFALSEALFRRAIERDPTYAQARGNLALLYDLQGRREKALASYKEALLEEPANQAVRNNYAAYLIDSGEEGAFEYGRENLQEAHAVRQHPIVDENLDRINRYEKGVKVE